MAWIRMSGGKKAVKPFNIFDGVTGIPFHASGTKSTSGALTSGATRGVNCGNYSGGNGVVVYSDEVDFTNYNKLIIELVGVRNNSVATSCYGYGTGYSFNGWNNITISNGAKEIPTKTGSITMDISKVVGNKRIYFMGCGGDSTNSACYAGSIRLEK